MLLEGTDLRIEGEQGTVLFEVYSCVVMLLEETGHTREQSDALALQLLPRLHDRLASAGCIVRQLDESSGRHRNSGGWPNDGTELG